MVKVILQLVMDSDDLFFTPTCLHTGKCVSHVILE